MTRLPATIHGKTVQSTSMFRHISFALLAGVSLAGLGIQQAFARDPQARFFTQPTAVYADQSTPQPSEQRLAYAERPNMGGGFIESLFGDVQQQDRIIRNSAMIRARSMRRNRSRSCCSRTRARPLIPRSIRNSRGSSSNITARKPPAPSSSIRRASSSTSCKAAARRFATELASASPVFCGRASRRYRRRRNGPPGPRLQRC